MPPVVTISATLLRLILLPRHLHVFEAMKTAPRWKKGSGWDKGLFREMNRFALEDGRRSCCGGAIQRGRSGRVQQEGAKTGGIAVRTFSGQVSLGYSSFVEGQRAVLSKADGKLGSIKGAVSKDCYGEAEKCAVKQKSCMDTLDASLDKGQTNNAKRARADRLWAEARASNGVWYCTLSRIIRQNTSFAPRNPLRCAHSREGYGLANMSSLPYGRKGMPPPHKVLLEMIHWCAGIAGSARALALPLSSWV